jgi:hypothetical protein
MSADVRLDRSASYSGRSPKQLRHLVAERETALAR